MDIISNEEINNLKVEKATNIILDLQKELKSVIETGAGPFLAAIYDKDDNELSVVRSNQNGEFEFTLQESFFFLKTNAVTDTQK